MSRPFCESNADLSSDAVCEISEALRALLADVFAICMKTKNFHWHMMGLIFATITCCSTSKRSSYLA
jgi:starvation-inducible DNA-binding protein